MRLAYESQRESALDRARRRAMRLQHVLGSTGGTFDSALSDEDVREGDFDDDLEDEDFDHDPAEGDLGES